jgi:peptide/nickel transport system ATP-binding protein
MLLNIENLHIEVVKKEGRQLLCKDLTFSIQRGETLGILGESGSGKSITAVSILKLLPPSIFITKGKINFLREDGVVDLVQCATKELQDIRGKEISMVFQEPMSSLNPVYTCGDQVMETILKHQKKTRREAKEIVLGLFEKVRLPDPQRIFQSFPHQLSGGQKQRVMIAMAISCRPNLLIADEPTTALDVTVQRSILDLLKELQAEMGMSIMFISHDISVIAEIAQHILVFYKGEIVEQGKVDTILRHANHPYTQGLIGCRSAVHTKGERLTTLEGYSHSSVTGILKDQPVFSKEVFLNSENIPVEKPFLRIRNLDLFFQRSTGPFSTSTKKQILHQITFDVFEGETLGLVGESGSGKTTIGRTIMQLIRAESGDIEFQGRSVQQLSRRDLKAFRKNVQIIFQDPYSSLNPKMTVGEILSEPLIVHHLCNSAAERKQRVLELLSQVNLTEDHYDRYPHQFSGGQRQRIGIARALAVEPKLIILDESVSALDVSIQAQVLNLLNDLKKKYRLTYIFISHDLNTVRYMSDRMIVLKEGTIVEAGGTEDIFLHPRDPYTVNLIAAIPSEGI